MARDTESKYKPEGKAKRKRHDQETRSKPKRRRHEPAESKDAGVNGAGAKEAPSASAGPSAVDPSGPRNIAKWDDATDSITSAQNGNHGAPSPLWRLSEPMGGRMSDIDPMFSRDEK